MPISSLHKIISHLNEIGRIAENLYKVEKRSILHIRATRISEEALKAREWAISLESERDELEKQNLVLRHELARVKGEKEPATNDRDMRDPGQRFGGGKKGE